MLEVLNTEINMVLVTMELLTQSKDWCFRYKGLVDHIVQERFKEGLGEVGW